MPSSRDLLQRFRPAGTPGSATAPGVPADRHAQAQAELASVLAAFSSVAAECDRVRREGDADAERIQREGRERSLAVVSTARQEAVAEREEVIARGRRDADSAAEQAMREAHETANLIEQTAADRYDDDLAQIVAAVRATLHEMADASEQEDST